MQAAQALLLAALRNAPRRYRLPPLPAGVEAARAAGVEAALAFAIEAGRLGQHGGRGAPEAVRDLFTSALAAFIREAMAPQGGDPSFQALVLQAGAAEVREFAQLSAGSAADRRAVRSMTDAIAHPGKTRRLPPGSARVALERLHALADSGAWAELDDALRAGPHEAIARGPALQRLLRGEALRQGEAVRRYLALCAQRGPGAGSPAAAARGRSAARAGDDAERATVEAFEILVRLLQARLPGAYRVLRSLRPPSGFPGERGKAKDEWDVAIVCEAAAGSADLLLLAEVKASPAAASSDFARLHRGLQRLAQAEAGRDYAFAIEGGGTARLAGASLRALQPAAGALPEHVVYCCTAPPEPRPQLLAAASKAMLAAEPASLAYAQRLARGAATDDEELRPVWDALLHAPRLRATLHQDATARLVREAMLHPADLVASFAGA
ncbi:hypothetical protein GCM10028796_34400 [Ramlibacter monticola]|uniref:hypothetical protein n=1 Tax=Ramlibacter monticola TaxID=1926872 RepID=UPI001F264036|nr:hypothetical protein [Ramlibacter monticola]